MRNVSIVCIVFKARSSHRSTTVYPKEREMAPFGEVATAVDTSASRKRSRRAEVTDGRSGFRKETIEDQKACTITDAELSKHLGMFSKMTGKDRQFLTLPSKERTKLVQGFRKSLVVFYGITSEHVDQLCGQYRVAYDTNSLSKFRAKLSQIHALKSK